jgi:hypothetical protein
MSPAISWLNSICKTETSNADARDIIERIRDEQWKGWIGAVRAGERPKDTLPSVMVSGTFSSRDGTNGAVAEKLIQHSGLLCADLDNIGDDLEQIRGQLNSSKHLCASFVSPSGKGLKAWFYVPADASLHAGSFRAVEKHVLELTGRKIDQACKDVGRLCFISSDSEAYYNPNRFELTPLPEPEKPKAQPYQGTNGKPTEDQIRQMLSLFTERPDYLDWIKITAAVGDALPDDRAIEVLKEWRPEEEPGQYAEKLKHRLRDVHIGTLIQWAQQRGYEYEKPLLHGELSEIEMVPIVYLDKPLWQRGAFTMLTGKKNSGKSVILYRDAARMTRGELGEKRRVIWISVAEDDYAMDVAPRLKAAGADLSRVTYLKQDLVLPRDVAGLKRLVREKECVGMIVIDPISGTMPRGNRNSNLDTDIRNCIGDLNKFAAELDVLVVGVRHLKKTIVGDAIDNVMGGGDWVYVPRVVLTCAHDKDDPTIRHIRVTTGNRMPPGSEGLKFRLESVPDIVPGGEPIVRAVLLGESSEDINELLQAGAASTSVSKTKQAKIAILAVLPEAASEGIESDNLTARIADEYGLKAGTVKNAKTALKDAGLIRVVPEKDETGKVLRWIVKRTRADIPGELKATSRSQKSHVTGCNESQPDHDCMPDTKRHDVDMIWSDVALSSDTPAAQITPHQVFLSQGCSDDVARERSGRELPS